MPKTFLVSYSYGGIQLRTNNGSVVWNNNSAQNSQAFDFDGGNVLSCVSNECIYSIRGKTNVLHVYSLVSAVLVQRLTLPFPAASIFWKNDFLYIGGVGGQIGIWNTGSGRFIGIFRAHSRSITCIECTSSFLITGCADGSISVFVLAQIIASCCFDEANTTSSSSDGLGKDAVLTSVKAIEAFATCTEHGLPVVAIAIDNYSKMPGMLSFVSLGMDRTLRLFSLMSSGSNVLEKTASSGITKENFLSSIRSSNKRSGSIVSTRVIALPKGIPATVSLAPNGVLAYVGINPVVNNSEENDVQLADAMIVNEARIIAVPIVTTVGVPIPEMLISFGEKIKVKSIDVQGSSVIIGLSDGSLKYAHSVSTDTISTNEGGVKIYKTPVMSVVSIAPLASESLEASVQQSSNNNNPIGQTIATFKQVEKVRFIDEANLAIKMADNVSSVNITGIAQLQKATSAGTSVAESITKFLSTLQQTGSTSYVSQICTNEVSAFVPFPLVKTGKNSKYDRSVHGDGSNAIVYNNDSDGLAGKSLEKDLIEINNFTDEDSFPTSINDDHNCELYPEKKCDYEHSEGSSYDFRNIPKSELKCIAFEMGKQAEIIKNLQVENTILEEKLNQSRFMFKSETDDIKSTNNETYSEEMLKKEVKELREEVKKLRAQNSNLSCIADKIMKSQLYDAAFKM